MIEYEKGAIQVVVMIVAKDLGIKPSLVQERMRKEKITREPASSAPSCRTKPRDRYVLRLGRVITTQFATHCIKSLC